MRASFSILASSCLSEVREKRIITTYAYDRRLLPDTGKFFGMYAVAAPTGRRGRGHHARSAEDLAAARPRRRHRCVRGQVRGGVVLGLRTTGAGQIVGRYRPTDESLVEF